mgnify:FL=1
MGHLVLFGAVLPILGWQSGRRFATVSLPPRRQYFATVIVQQLFLGTIATVVWWRLELDLFTPFRPRWTDLALAAAFLASAVALAVPQWRRSIEGRDRRIYLVAPRDGPERLLWAGISVAAGIFEEIAYRGVLFWIIEALTGSVLVSVALSALAFSLAHLVQGPKAAGFVFVFGLGFHGLVLATETLSWAIVVHIAFDLIAGYRLGRLAEAAGLPLEVPAPITDSPVQTPS